MKKICSLNLSIELRITHKAVINMITKYQKDFEIYGPIKTEREKPGKGTKGGRPKRIIYLNDKQKSLLFLYLGNNKLNRKNKIKINDLAEANNETN